MKHKTGFVYSPFYLKHETGHHPESNKRLLVIIDQLKEIGLYDKLLHLEPYKATEQDAALVHDPDYVKSVWKKCVQKINHLDTDTVICEESYNVALTAAGGIMRAVDAVLNNEVENCFCAVRPPGHHASSDKGMGFCLFNNIAIGARYAQKKYKIKKILIVDFDAHHGNGTQEIFYKDPSVFYFSIHQYPHYPGTGKESEQGIDAGIGFTINTPVKAEISEIEFLKKFKDVLIPNTEKFKPNLIMISAGFDSHKDDFLANLPLTENGYIAMTKTIKELANRFCYGKIISVLEGGYNLKALARSVSAHIETLTKE